MVSGVVVLKALKAFRSALISRIDTKTSWGKNELAEEIQWTYERTLEDLIIKNSVELEAKCKDL